MGSCLACREVDGIVNKLNSFDDCVGWNELTRRFGAPPNLHDAELLRLTMWNENVTSRAELLIHIPQQEGDVPIKLLMSITGMVEMSLGGWHKLNVLWDCEFQMVGEIYRIDLIPTVGLEGWISSSEMSFVIA